MSPKPTVANTVTVKYSGLPPLAIGYRPAVPRAALWAAIAGLLGADMALAAVMGRTSACGRPTGSSTAH